MILAVSSDFQVTFVVRLRLFFEDGNIFNEKCDKYDKNCNTSGFNNGLVGYFVCFALGKE